MLLLAFLFFALCLLPFALSSPFKLTRIRPATPIDNRFKTIGAGKLHIVEVFRDHILGLKIYHRNKQVLIVLVVLVVVPDIPAAYVYITVVIGISEVAIGFKYKTATVECRSVPAAETKTVYVI